MKIKLRKISTKSFILIFSSINVIAGFILGAVVTIGSLIVPSEPGSGPGAWSILVFPILNGILGLAGALFLSGMYNVLAKYLGGIELEFETLEG